MKCYRNITTDEVVYKEEAENYVLNRLGLTVTPKGKNGEMTQETIIWFFSGNWVEEEIKESKEPSVFDLINEECELEDAKY